MWQVLLGNQGFNKKLENIFFDKRKTNAFKMLSWKPIKIEKIGFYRLSKAKTGIFKIILTSL